MPIEIEFQIFVPFHAEENPELEPDLFCYDCSYPAVGIIYSF